jgi:hypothetical protein
MSQRTLIDRLLSPAGFGLVLLLFLLPFVTVSCGVKTGGASADVEQSFSFTGVDLVVGGSPDITVSGRTIEGVEESETVEGDEAAVMAVFDERYGKYYPPQPLAVGAALVIFAGMLAGLLLPLARRSWANAVAAQLGALLLAIEVFVIAGARAEDAITEGLSDVDGAAEAIAAGALTWGTSPGIGFWLAVLVLVGLAAWQAHVAYHGKARAAPPDGPPEAGPPSQDGQRVPPAVPGAPESGGTPLL